jgi:hypothetical protein
VLGHPPQNCQKVAASALQPEGRRRMSGENVGKRKKRRERVEKKDKELLMKFKLISKEE